MLVRNNECRVQALCSSSHKWICFQVGTITYLDLQKTVCHVGAHLSVLHIIIDHCRMVHSKRTGFFPPGSPLHLCILHLAFTNQSWKECHNFWQTDSSIDNDFVILNYEVFVIWPSLYTFLDESHKWIYFLSASANCFSELSISFVGTTARMWKQVVEAKNDNIAVWAHFHMNKHTHKLLTKHSIFRTLW